MGEFQCSKCGHNWFSNHTFAVCPVCIGVGLKDKKCTCRCFAMPASGEPTGVPAEINTNCLVHGGNNAPNKM